MRHVLFICTGNYYRSRMAEELFNFLALRYEMGWRADSAGLRSDMTESPNEGPISQDALSMLAEKGYPVSAKKRFPRSVNREDFRKNDLVICLHQKEHEPMIMNRFHDFSSDIIYWDVADIEELEASSAFGMIYTEVVRLLSKLDNSQDQMLWPIPEDLRSRLTKGQKMEFNNGKRTLLNTAVDPEQFIPSNE